MRRSLPSLLSALVIFLMFSAVAFAAPEGGGDVEVHKKSWFELFKSTGMVGVLLLSLSIVGTALLIQFTVTLTAARLGNPVFLDEVEQLLSQGNIEEATAAAQAEDSYAGKVLTAGLNRSANGFEEVRRGFEESAAAETFRINAKISLLSLVGNVGPLMGLLGTVTGMISSFQVIETLKSPTPKDLAVGVYESLVNTTIGLFISIVFLSAYFFLKNKIADITLQINNEVGDMLTRSLGSEDSSK